MCLCAPLVKPYQYKISGVTWGQEYDSFGAFFEVSHDGDRYRDCAQKGAFCEIFLQHGSAQSAASASRRTPCARRRTLSFWKEIFLQHDDLHKAQGRWFMRATDASRGGVQCDMASFLTDQNEKRLTEATMDDAVRCQCLPEGDGKDHHATFYPDDVVDEVQLISLDSIKLEKETAQAAAAPNAQEAALGEAYLADDRRISELMARGATRIAALGAGARARAREEGSEGDDGDGGETHEGEGESCEARIGDGGEG